MIEMPEATTIAKQMNETLTGKTFHHFSRGAIQHKFLWLSDTPEKYDATLSGKQVTGARSYGRSILLVVDDTHTLLFADLGGRILYHPASAELPAKYHLRWDFTDESSLTFAMQMWGYVGLLDKGAQAAPAFSNVGIPPLSEEFTRERFDQLLEEFPEKTSKGIKGFLTTSKYVFGIGNGYLQDILFRAKLRPTRKIPTLSQADREKLYDAVQFTIGEAIRLGGRDDERDLFDHPGGYKRLMNNEAVGKPCPECGTLIQKQAYLGGACYFCPSCQV